MRLVIATNNPGKVREIRAILDLPGLEIVSLADLGKNLEVVEDGRTFEENARKKALSAYSEFGMPALADDSGLEIDALGGKPGVHSSRFLGELSYAERCEEILRRLRNVPSESRTARFRCCAVVIESVADPNHAFEGVCQGRIGFEARGSDGFGYDPIFVPDGFNKTFAELGPEVKNRISHRAQAFLKVRDFLQTRPDLNPR